METQEIQPDIQMTLFDIGTKSGEYLMYIENRNNIVL